MNDEGPKEDGAYYRGITCPRCGEPNDVGVQYCKNCGWDLKGNRKYNIAFIILFVVIGIPALCLGGCALWIGGFETRGGKYDFSVTPVALVSFGVFALLLFLAFFWKKK
jgi:hypothetical protein